MFLCITDAERAARMLKRACVTVTDGVEVLPDANQCRKGRECKVGPYTAVQNNIISQFYLCGRA